jgi:MoxR-like ATPase
MDLGFSANFFDPATRGTVHEETVTVHAEHGPSYVYSRSVILAVNLALACHRPLFITGRPGTGKTTLAWNVAHVLGWKYYQKVITSRTRARDLMWRFDSLRRLSDAQERDKTLPPRAAYVQPEVLWWAFNPVMAAQRGATAAELDMVSAASDPGLARDDERAVVLLDEIDKAEPDVPNDLLEVLDVARFTVDELETPREVAGDREGVLIMITTNGERELPPAFIRRCVVLTLGDPTEDWLVTIANDRYGNRHAGFHREIAARVMKVRELAHKRDLREPSTAEYLDTIRACRELRIDSSAPSWKMVADSLLWKREKPPLPDEA